VIVNASAQANRLAGTRNIGGCKQKKDNSNQRILSIRCNPNIGPVSRMSPLIGADRTFSITVNGWPASSALVAGMKFLWRLARSSTVWWPAVLKR